MDLDNNSQDDVEIELEEIAIKDLLKDIDVSKSKVSNPSKATEFIDSLICNSIKFPIVLSSKDNKTFLMNKDKLIAITLFLNNTFKLDIRLTNLHYGEGYACDLPEGLIRVILDKKVPVIYIDDSKFNKDVMDNIARELNFYPYPYCMNSVI